MHFYVCMLYFGFRKTKKKIIFLDTQVSFFLHEVLKQNQDIYKYFNPSINLSYCSVSILICTQRSFSNQSFFSVFPFFFIKKYFICHWVSCLWSSIATVFILIVFMCFEYFYYTLGVIINLSFKLVI